MATKRSSKPSGTYNGAELITIRHNKPKDGQPYTLEVTRKAWDAGVYPRSEFERLSEAAGKAAKAQERAAAEAAAADGGGN